MAQLEHPMRHGLIAILVAGGGINPRDLDLCARGLARAHRLEELDHRDAAAAILILGSPPRIGEQALARGGAPVAGEEAVERRGLAGQDLEAEHDGPLACDGRHQLADEPGDLARPVQVADQHHAGLDDAGRDRELRGLGRLRMGWCGGGAAAGGHERDEGESSRHFDYYYYSCSLRRSLPHTGERFAGGHSGRASPVRQEPESITPSTPSRPAALPDPPTRRPP